MYHSMKQRSDTYNMKDIELLEKIEYMIANCELKLQEGMSLTALGVDRKIAFKEYLTELAQIGLEVEKISDVFLKETTIQMIVIHINDFQEKIKQFNLLY